MHGGVTYSKESANIEFIKFIRIYSFGSIVAAAYFVAVATAAAFIGQHVVRKMIIILGRASLIIFILAFTIFVSAISLGKLHFLLLGW